MASCYCFTFRKYETIQFFARKNQVGNYYYILYKIVAAATFWESFNTLKVGMKFSNHSKIVLLLGESRSIYHPTTIHGQE
jgi:hypothetical protein